MKHCITLLLSFIAVCLFYCCNNTSSNTQLAEKLIRDSIAHQKAIDEQMKKGERPDSAEIEDGPEQGIKYYLGNYNKIQYTDTTIIDGTDTLHIHFKYYCLHDSSLVIPKIFNGWWQHLPKDFLVNNFAAKICVLKNRDTIFNKVVLKSDFNSVITDESRKRYAAMYTADFSKYDLRRKLIFFSFSISIPGTDLGDGVCLIIDKKGNYKVSDRPIL